MVLGYPCYIFYRIHATMFAEKFIGLAAIEENINNITISDINVCT